MWAPGLTKLVQASWSRWYAENGVEADAEARQIMQARLSAEKRWQLHEVSGFYFTMPLGLVWGISGSGATKLMDHLHSGCLWARLTNLPEGEPALVQ